MGALIALIQKLHLCINQLEQVIDRLYNNFIFFSQIASLRCRRRKGRGGEGRGGERD